MKRWLWVAIGLSLFGLIEGLFVANARGEDSPQPQQVREESKCQPIIQEFNQMKLVSLQINPITEEAKFVYGKLVNRHMLILWLFVRDKCTEPMRLVESQIFDPNPKECEPGTSCL